MNRSLPRLDNLAFTKGVSEKHHQMLYGLRAFPPRKVQPPPRAPTRLVGTQLTHRGVSCQSYMLTAKETFPRPLHKRSDSAVNTAAPLLVDLFGYYPLIESAGEPDIHQPEYSILSQSTGTVGACSPIQEKVMLSTFSRPPSSLKTSHASVASVKSIIVPSLTDAMTGPLSSLKARPNSARQMVTPTSPSRSPSPSCLNRDFIHNNRVLSHTGQRSTRATRDSAKDTVSGGTSVIYSLGIPRESPHSVGTPVYDLSAQFFLQSNSPIRRSLPSDKSFSISPSSIEAEISLADSPDSVSTLSIEPSNASELTQYATDHVIMDQPIYCKRPISAPYAHPHFTEPKTSVYSQHSIRKCTSACSSQLMTAANLAEGDGKSQKPKPSYAQRDKINRFCPQVRERLSISSTLLHSQASIPSLYNFKVSAYRKGRSVSVSENSQLRQLVPCTNATEYISGLIDRRGFHPYASRHTTIHS